ncbi:MAG: IMP cyclohydrolase [Lachnospiraceae bacterium]|nr:IMP cyclohydrolase [Lachnospiraceae bacterium]MBQ3399949.1 IMP cyclohydrolase [Lachnospiraceae bacterium]MBQ4308666.1 IMP cyclohydrolase [Lachnospiraceae bacterium]
MAQNFGALLNANPYPGRGIMLGKSPDGKAVIAYFIMGRSENSRNRVFVTEGEGIRTQAFDPSKMTDPSLIIYAPVRVLGDKTIVTNGDQTDTIYDGMAAGKTFEESLRVREFEPDGPNYTPRISGMIEPSADGFSVWMSILKSNGGDPSACHRYTFSYDVPKAGEGHFISTYQTDGNPLPSFAGEPIAVEVTGDIDAFTENVWNSLNADNKVSLFTRFIDFAAGTCETRIVNKHEQ